jgi:CheY-like chemotaxis protein
LTQRKKPGATAGSGSAEPDSDRELIGSIVHDLKNVLSAIRGFATVIGEDLRPHDPARDDVEQILTAVDRGAELAQRLLAWRGPIPTPSVGVPVEVALERSIGWTMQQPRRAATILVVEDDDLVRTMTVKVLRRSGYATLEAANAAEAEDWAATHGVAVDLLLVDIGLPVTNGLALWERVEERWPGSKILFMSAFGRTALAEQGTLPEGGFLEKPFAPVTLIERIETILAPGSS